MDRGKMKVRLFLSPLDAPLAEAEIEKKTRLLDLFKTSDGICVFEHFEDGSVIQLNGEVIPPSLWSVITVKPVAGTLDLIRVPRGKKTFALLAAVALVAITAGIAAFGVPFLGAGFAAGTLGANLAAAGIGIVGSLAINALSAPPKVGNNGEERQTTQAGVSGNAVTLLDTLPYIAGTVGASLPMIAPPYVSWDGDTLYSNMIVGCEGPCAIDDIRINGLPIDSFAGVEYEWRDGFNSNPRTLFLDTVIEERDGVTLSNFVTELETNKNDLLVDQAEPSNSAPQWHIFRSAGKFTELVLRFLFPSGIVYTADGTEAIVPVRIEMRKVGDVDWRKLPTFHFADYRAGSGPMRVEIRIERRDPISGIHWSTAIDEYPVCNVMNITNIGDTPYESDTYFQEDGVWGASQGIRAIQRALFTSATNSEGYTISASSVNGADSGWKSSSSTDLATPYWRPTDGTVGTGCYLQWDCPSATTFRSYFLSSGDGSSYQNYTPIKWRVLGSTDNWATSTQLDEEDIDVSENPTALGDYQIGNPGSYTSYRWVFLGVVSGTQLRVSRLNPNTGDAIGCMFSDPGGRARGSQSYHSSSYNKTACKYVHLDKRGARVFLKPEDWDEGEYELRIKRGVAVFKPNFEPYANTGTKPYTYNGTSGNAAHYFDYFSSAGSYKISLGQRNYRSDCTIEAFQTIDSGESPFDDTGIALIAVKIPNTQVSSLYARLRKYARIFTAGIWKDEFTLTDIPAAHYRDLLLGKGNAKPVPGEAIGEQALADWYTRCETDNLRVGAILQGARVGEAKQMLATAGYASPRDSDLYEVVEDKDTSSDPIRYLITPQNSRDEGNISEIRELPDALRAEFNNEEKSFAVDHVIVYREGFNASTAKVFETISYTGITNQTLAEERAAFDLRQMYLRQAKYSREVGLEFFGVKRGDLVGLGDDTIDGDRAAGWISHIERSAGNIISITLDNIMPWGVSEDVSTVEDVTALTDVLDPSEPMGIAIRRLGNDILQLQVSEISDSNVCTLSTPIADDGTVKEDLLVVAGPFYRIVRRCKVLQVVPRGFEKRLLILTDEAPELFD